MSHCEIAGDHPVGFLFRTAGGQDFPLAGGGPSPDAGSADFIGGKQMLVLAEKDKKNYLPLLLLGDEQESMIHRYLERGTLYLCRWNKRCRGSAGHRRRGRGTGAEKHRCGPRLSAPGHWPGHDRSPGSAVPGKLPDVAGGHRGSPLHHGLLPELRVYPVPPGEGFLSPIRPPPLWRTGCS